MTIEQILNLAIEIGIKNDFRSRKQIEKKLKRIKVKYEKLSPNQKEFFDRQKLTNPYPDSGIQFDGGTKNIKTVMAGIDIEPAEMMIARYLSNHNPKKPIDAVICHHPVGRNLADINEVMDMMADIMHMHGVPINIAEGILHDRIEEVERRFHADNHYQVVDSARLLNINLMNVHTPCDNLAAQYMQKEIEKRKPEFVEEVVDLILDIPEYAESAKRGVQPKIFSGNAQNRAGKIAVMEFTGGTSYSKITYEKLAHAGIGTIISMHQGEEHRKEAQKYHINVVVAPHIASDSLGMNLFLDELEKKGIEIVPCSGLIRISRNKLKVKK